MTAIGSRTIPSVPFARRAMRTLALLCASLAITPADAATVCASSVASLQAALVAGQFQNQAYTIRIVQGSYPMNASLNFVFSAPTTIEGGYTANCAARDVDPANTVVEPGSGHGLWWRQNRAQPEAQISVDGITLRNAQYVHFEAGDFDPDPFSGDEPGSVTLRRTRITQIVTPAGTRPIRLSAFSTVHMENVLLDHIDAADTCAVVLTAENGASVRVNHLTADLAAGEHFCFNDRNRATQMSIHNSILWSSDGGQSTFRVEPGASLNSDTSISLINALFQLHALGFNATVANQINADPIWVDAASGNYALAHNQVAGPAINSGTIIVPVGEPATDIRGDQRVAGSAPDRGAYESGFNNFAVLTVTNSANAGAGSLRQALLDANSSPGIAKTIQFDIRSPGNLPICPAVIGLSTTLPEIAAPISIDGYSQPTALKNTDANAFNAKLCVLIKPASGTLATAFRVPQSAPAGTTLVLRGVGLGGFGQPVQILGGSDHLIAGNQFGGSVAGVALAGAGLSAVTLGVNAGGSLIIGGQDLAARNVFGGAGVSGISIQSGVQSSIDQCQVINNLIGLAPDGLSELANNIGINLSGSGCALVGNRVAGNTTANLWINGNNNRVQQNRIGLDAQEAGLINSAMGVIVQGNNNLIGASGNGGSVAGNVIRFNSAGGVVIRGATAIGNSVQANAMGDNGFDGFVGAHLDIDLQTSAASAGPDTNDIGDLDEGPNRGQNYPDATGLVFTAPVQINRPATVSGVLDSQPGSYRIDVYFSSASHQGHGQAEVYLGHTNLSISALNPQPQAFSKNILVPNQLPGGVISFTATDAAGNTSELGTAISVLDPFVFGSGFE